MKLIKTDHRNRLSGSSFCNIMRVNLLSPDIADFDPTEAIHTWNSQSSRKRRTMFKSSDRASLQHAQLDAQAEEEELPPNPSAEIPMADPATVHCDDDVEVNSVFILILTFQTMTFHLYLILSKMVDLLNFYLC